MTLIKLGIILNFVKYNTPDKKQIIEYLEKSPDESYTPERISEELGISRSTVYRILSDFTADGSVARTVVGRKASYRIQGRGCSDHMHIRCALCGHIEHLDEKSTIAIENIISRDSGFRALASSMLTGICSRCREGR